MQWEQILVAVFFIIGVLAYPGLNLILKYDINVTNPFKRIPTPAIRKRIPTPAIRKRIPKTVIRNAKLEEIFGV
ncbi:hypothetical protein K0U27_02890 [archaeon]|nr:hypothetical protein [archaeon]